MRRPAMDVVTGAFGYTGRFITQRLLQSASVVRTLTNHPRRPNPFGERVELAPLPFADRRALVASLRGGDVLINNIAWLLRRLPVFGIAGSGDYRIRPVHVDDVAAIAVAAGHREDDVVLDAVGPETYKFEELVRLIANTVGRRPVIVHVAPWVALA